MLTRRNSTSDKKKMDQTKQSVTSLEHNLRRSNGSHQRSQKEVQKALNSAKTLRNQIKTLVKATSEAQVKTPL